MSRLFIALPVLMAFIALSGIMAAVLQSDLELFPSDIVGVTLCPDGQTPVADLPVRVWSVDKDKMIYKTQTDKDGGFRIPSLSAGRCFIFVGRVKVDINVLRNQQNALTQHADWVVVMPRSLLLTKTPEIYDLLMTTPALLIPQERPSGSHPVLQAGSSPVVQPEPKPQPPLEPPVVSP